MVKLYVMSGPSGCGKSYLAKTIVYKEGARLVSTDGIRGEIFGDESIQRNPFQVFKIAFQRVETFLSAGIDVVFDATNLKPQDRKKLLNLGRKYGAQCICYGFIGNYNNCIYNQQIRLRQVPSHVIMNQINSYVVPTKEEGWDDVKIVEVEYHG